MPNLKDLPWKKIIIITGFIVLCAGLAYAIYFLFFQPDIIPDDEEKTAEELQQLPIAGSGEIIPTEIPETITPPTPSQITVRERVAPVTEVDDFAQGSVTRVTDLDFETTPAITLDSSGNNAMSYNEDSGNFYRINQDGTKTLLTSKSFKKVENITWAPNTEKAILEFPDSSNIIYDFSTNQQITLPKSWTDFSFDSTESQIAFKDMDENDDKRFLAISNLDGSNQKYIEFIGKKSAQIDVNWSPNNQIVATYTEASSSNFSKLYFIGQNQENFRSIDINGYNVDMQYTPTGDKIVYSAHNSFSDNKPVMYIVDAMGDRIGYNHNSLNLNTWANKCTFADDNSMYCAVPKELPEGSGWFPELADDIGDYIYRINLTTGAKSFIAEPEFDYAIDQMQVSDDGSTLYFTDKATQTLHKIRLK